MQTDFFIQKVIREKFANTTIITIAHRLRLRQGDSDRAREDRRIGHPLGATREEGRVSGHGQGHWQEC